jgi:hypothetical protein
MPVRDARKDQWDAELGASPAAAVRLEAACRASPHGVHPIHPHPAPVAAHLVGMSRGGLCRGQRDGAWGLGWRGPAMAAIIARRVWGSFRFAFVPFCEGL